MWSADAEPLRVSSFNLKEVPSKAGKCAVWQVTFVSKQKRKSLSYTYSVIKSGTSLRKGVRAGLEESWSGRGQARPFIRQLLKIDSTQAFDKGRGEERGVPQEKPGFTRALPAGIDAPIHPSGLACDLGENTRIQQTLGVR